MKLAKYQTPLVTVVYITFVLLMILISMPQFDFFSSYQSKVDIVKVSADRDINQVVRDTKLKWKNVGAGHKEYALNGEAIWTKFSFTNNTTFEDWIVGNIFASYDQMSYFIKRSDGSIETIPVNKYSNIFMPQVSFTLAPDETVEIYSQTFLDPLWMIDVRILPREQFAFGSKLLMLFSATYLGALFILALGGLTSFFTLKETSYLYFFTFNSCLAIFYLILDGNFISFFGYPVETSETLFRVFWCIGVFACLSFTYFIKSFLHIKNDLVINTYTASCWLSVLALATLRADYLITNMTIVIAATNILTVYLILPYLKLKNIRDIIVGIAGVSATLLISSLALTNITQQTTLNLRVYCFGNLWMGLCFFLALSKKFLTLDEEKQTLSAILSGQVPKTALNEIATSPYGFSYTFKEQNVTILFIDIVGFSLSSEKMGATKSFTALSGWLNRIYHIIEASGGHIDRSLGDGFLCFFGYNSSDPKIGARNAFRAAVSIQELAVKTMKQADKRSKAFPLRIGMNTAKVVIGNLGGEKRTDYTMIGEGVNYASRLESACNSFKISLSETTHALLSRSEYNAEGMNKIFIKIKHHAAFKTAYEYNPFINSKQRLIDAEQNYFNSLSTSIKEQRKNIKEMSIFLTSDIGSFEVLDFSESGFGVRSEIFLGPKTQLNVRLELDSKDFSERLAKTLLASFSVEVRWSRKSNDVFKHGFLIKGLNDQQKLFILDILEQYSSLEEANPAWKANY